MNKHGYPVFSDVLTSVEINSNKELLWNFLKIFQDVIFDKKILQHGQIIGNKKISMINLIFQGQV